jgi:hypothetical protein
MGRECQKRSVFDDAAWDTDAISGRRIHPNTKKLAEKGGQKKEDTPGRFHFLG